MAWDYTLSILSILNIDIRTAKELSSKVCYKDYGHWSCLWNRNTNVRLCEQDMVYWYYT